MIHVLPSLPGFAAQGIETVGAVLGVDMGELLGRARSLRVVAARRLACRWLTLAGYSSTEVGRLVARDHASVLAHLRCDCGARVRPTSDPSQACSVCGAAYWAPLPEVRRAPLLALATGRSELRP